MRQSNLDAFVAKLDSIDFDHLFSLYDSIDDKVSAFNCSINLALPSVLRKIEFAHEKDKPWITPKLKLLIKERWLAYRQSNFDKYNYLKNKIHSEITSAKRNWISSGTTSALQIWSFVNELAGRKNKNVPSILLKN